MSALDNIEARKRVNSMAIDAKIPLVRYFLPSIFKFIIGLTFWFKVESGTSGYLGQVTSVLGGQTMCYDCETKVEPRRFPVCTIHRTPSSIIHCIVWGKLVFSLVTMTTLKLLKFTKSYLLVSFRIAFR